MRKSILLIPLSIVAAIVLAGSTRDNDVLAEARKLQLEFREGKTELATPLVKMLEGAVKESPNNAALWDALGGAHMSQVAALSMKSPPDMPTLLATARQARDAYARSLELHAENPLSLASRGMASLVMAQYSGDGAGIMPAVEQMNEAVRRAPKSISVRLIRAFTTIYLPPAMRDTDAVIEDLRFILDNATSPRAEDMLHVLLGDVYAEIGKPDAARGEYRQVAGASSFAADEVKLLRRSRERRGRACIHRKVRQSTGSNCAACHAAGTDN